MLQLILQGWAQCFGEKRSWEAGEPFTEGATTESDFEVSMGLYRKRKRKPFSAKRAWQKLWDAKGKEQRVFYGAEIQRRVMRTMNLRRWVGARTEMTLLEM